MRAHLSMLVIALTLGALACSSSSDGGATTDASTDGDEDALPPIGGADRPVTVYVPPSYAPSTPAPLVVLLHGYSVTGALENIYMNLQPLADARGFLYAYPDGTENSKHLEFWNATDACCDMEHSGVDDSTYLIHVVHDIEARYNVDRKRIFFIGHSNGGFMSYRMACDHADEIAAIVSLAGAMWLDTSKCAPSGAVSVLEIHGTADDMVIYDGTADYPSAKTSVQDWATFDACGATPTDGGTLDLVPSLSGAETSVSKFGGCSAGSGVELWTVAGGNHFPAFDDAFRTGVVDFMFAHGKP
jgi:polyhydroxybutyrate depolymerase